MKHWMGASKTILNKLPEYAKDVPYQIKKISVRDVYLAFSNGCKKVKSTGEAFKLSYRSRKNPKQSCFIPSSALTNNGIYHTISGTLKMAELLPVNFKDSRLIYENRKWYLHIPYKMQTITAENQGKTVALDPGIRTFLTGFSQDCAFKIGEHDFSRIARLSVHADKIVSKISKSKAKQKYRLKNALSKMRFRVKNLIDELHFKSINFLVKTFDQIILPTFNTKDMCIRVKRKIRSKSVRSMLSYAFFRFGQRLESKARSLGKIVLRVSEAYTSKTASWTGEIKNIGSAKYIKSNGLTMDRDINGTRGIYLRALGDNPLLLNKHALLAIGSNC